MAKVRIKAVLLVDGTKVPIDVSVTWRKVTHKHPLPTCVRGQHDLSCRKHGVEISCTKPLLVDPNYHKKKKIATCTHLVF